MDLRELEEKNYIVNKGGQQFIRYGGLLFAAHQKGIVKIRTEWVNKEHLDRENPFFIFKAEVDIESGDKVFHGEGHGDTTLKNTGKMIIPHMLRMAETRAVVRALRVATGISLTALEELGENTDNS